MDNSVVASLESQLRHHNRLYYDMSEPEISDDDYDVIFERLQDLEPDSPVLNERAQDSFDDDFKHVIPMGSQAKIKTADDLYERFKGHKVTCTPKLDGAGLAVHYDNGRLVMAVTRGRTETGKGKIVTPVAQVIDGIPSSVPETCSFEVRGEVIIMNDDFYGIMDQPGYDGRPDGYANPRNAASGALNARNPEDAQGRKLRFIPYKVLSTDLDVSFHAKQMYSLDRCGFMTLPFVRPLVDSIDAINAMIEKGSGWRGDLRGGADMLIYNIDGIVIRIDDEDIYTSKGMSGVCPNGSAAYKYQAVRSVTTLTDIEWETGRTGNVHPTGILDPVDVDGSTIGRVTLNNPTWMKQFPGLGVGATVEIEKGGDIIPNLVSVVAPGKGTKQPVECPSCGSVLGFELNSKGEPGVRLTCFDPASCPAQKHKAIKNMLTKLEIKGIASASIAKMEASGKLEHPTDIFDFDEHDFIGMGFGPGETRKMVDALSGVHAPVENVLAAIGLPMWGRRMFAKLMNNSDAYDAERLATLDFNYDEMVMIDAVGEAKAAALFRAFLNPLTSASQFFLELTQKVTIDFPKESTDQPLTDKSFCLSGSMSRGKKNIEMDIAAAGGATKSGISKKLDYLVAGEGSGSKSRKAIELEIPILTETELYEMLGEVMEECDYPEPEIADIPLCGDISNALETL